MQEDVAQKAKESGYSLFFIPQDSMALDLLRTVWDLSKEGLLKGVVEVPI